MFELAELLDLIELVVLSAFGAITIAALLCLDVRNRKSLRQ